MNLRLATETAAAGDLPGAGLGAVDKAMVVLIAVLSSDAPLNLTRLCLKTGLAKATVHRMLGILQTHQMVARVGDDYMPGELLFDPEQWFGSDFITVVTSESTPYLVELHQQTGGTASITLASGGVLYHLNRVYGHRSVRTPAPAARGMSLVFSESAIRRILSVHDQDSMNRNLVDVSETRRLGIAHDEDDGVSSVAVPVHTGPRRPSIALSVCGRTGQLDAPLTMKALRVAAFSLARDLRRGLAPRP